MNIPDVMSFFLAPCDICLAGLPAAMWVRISSPNLQVCDVVCTENSNSDIMVMQSAKDRVGVPPENYIRE